jgi:hypothetical protein
MWVLYQISRYWLSKEQVVRSYANYWRIDITGVEDWQRASAFALHFGLWLLAAAAAYCVWRLTSAYLEGRIFTLDATAWLRRTGLFGLVAVFLDFLTRPLLAMLLTAHMPVGHRAVAIAFQPQDLLNILFLTSFVAIAHIFHTASAIADEHSQIV